MDDNAAAAANMVLGGNSFWNRVQNYKQNKLQQTGLGIQQQQATTQEKNSAVQRALTQQAVKQAGVDTAQKQKSEFLQSYSPYDAAAQDVATQHLAAGSVPLGVSQQDYQNTLSSQMQNTPFDQLDPQSQEAIVTAHRMNAPSGVNITPEEVSMSQRQKYMMAHPSMPGAGSGLVPTEAEVNPLTGVSGVKYKLNPTIATPITSPGGSPTGMINIGGEAKPDPMAMTPKDITERQNRINTVKEAEGVAQNVQQLLKENPDLIGKGILSGGTKTGQLANTAASWAGNPDKEAKQTYIKQYLGGQLLDTLGQIHIGRVTEMEWNALQKNMPSMSDPKPVWDKYLTRLQTALQLSRQDDEDALKSYGGKQPSGNPFSPKLGPVNLQPSVRPPKDMGAGGGSAEAPGSSESTAASSGRPQVFVSPEQADRAGFPAGTIVRVMNPTTGRPSRYKIGGNAQAGSNSIKGAGVAQ